MTTTPHPSPEAVEAAIKWAKDCAVTDKEMRILGADDPYSYGTDTAARILAAEVERLRAVLQRIAEHGGRSTATGDGTITGTGAWCAEQAKEALAQP